MPRGSLRLAQPSKAELRIIGELHLASGTWGIDRSALADLCLPVVMRGVDEGELQYVSKESAITIGEVMKFALRPPRRTSTPYLYHAVDRVLKIWPDDYSVQVRLAKFGLVLVRCTTYRQMTYDGVTVPKSEPGVYVTGDGVRAKELLYDPEHQKLTRLGAKVSGLGNFLIERFPETAELYNGTAFPLLANGKANGTTPSLEEPLAADDNDDEEGEDTEEDADGGDEQGSDTSDGTPASDPRIE